MIVEDEYDPFSPIAKLRDICPNLMTSSDLLSTNSWDKLGNTKLLPAGLALLAGEPKIGKSYYLLKLAKDITENGGKVFYFAGEDSSYLLAEAFEARLGLRCWQKTSDLKHCRTVTHCCQSQASSKTQLSRCFRSSGYDCDLSRQHGDGVANQGQEFR